MHKLDYDALRSWATARVAEWEKAYASLAPVAIELRERAEKAEAANVVYEGQMKADSHKITQLRAAIDAAKEPR